MARALCAKMVLQIWIMTFLCSVTGTSALRCWTCENAKSMKDCFRNGYSKQCIFLEKVCQTEVRYSVGWSDKSSRIRTGCKEPHACGNNDIQNPRSAWYPTQCNGEKFNSVCRCCCAGDHCNKRSRMCQSVLEELASRSDTKHEYLKDQPMSEEPEIPLEKITCNILEEPKNGKMECHGGGEIGTECSFFCVEGYKLEGDSLIKCEGLKETLKWSNAVPKCVEIKCPPLSVFRHGNMTCTGRDNGIGTRCEFSCSEGYELLPSGRSETRCVEKRGRAVWTHRTPCCNAYCPPIAKKDIVVVIDSSMSISFSEWNTMKEFVSNVIKTFEVAQDAVQFAVYRFNGRVDTRSQVLFGDYENVDELVDAVKKLPKRRGGTQIGKALRHARYHVLKHNNREEASDMVWVLTDGKSKDDFKQASENLRQDGVEIIALWVSRDGEEEFMEKLVHMTGDEELVMKVDDVKNSFSSSLVERVTGKICEVSCE